MLYIYIIYTCICGSWILDLGSWIYVYIWSMDQYIYPWVCIYLGHNNIEGHPWVRHNLIQCTLKHSWINIHKSQSGYLLCEGWEAQPALHSWVCHHSCTEHIHLQKQRCFTGVEEAGWHLHCADVCAVFSQFFFKAASSLIIWLHFSPTAPCTCTCKNRWISHV